MAPNIILFDQLRNICPRLPGVASPDNKSYFTSARALIPELRSHIRCSQNNDHNNNIIIHNDNNNTATTTTTTTTDNNTNNNNNNNKCREAPAVQPQPQLRSGAELGPSPNNHNLDKRAAEQESGEGEQRREKARDALAEEKGGAEILLLHE